MKVVKPTGKPGVSYRDYDFRYAEVFRELSRIFTELGAPFILDHVGSTSVPGCGGKGTIDILAMYGDGKLEESKAFLFKLGFCKQGEEFQRAWPESRPMLLGYYGDAGEEFLIYVHVVHIESDEIRRFRTFRDRLTSNEGLMREYCEIKKNIIRDGILDTDDYAVGKREIIHRILGKDQELKSSRDTNE